MKFYQKNWLKLLLMMDQQKPNIKNKIKKPTVKPQQNQIKQKLAVQIPQISTLNVPCNILYIFF